MDRGEKGEGRREKERDWESSRVRGKDYQEGSGSKCVLRKACLMGVGTQGSKGAGRRR